MSVLIKDFEMPKSCIKCQFYSVDTHGCIIASYGCVDRYNFDVSVRQEWCPLVYVENFSCLNYPCNDEIKICYCRRNAELE